MTKTQIRANFKKAVKKAKQLYKSGRFKTFADAVKAAYGKKKVGAVTKKYRQTGTSNKRIDQQRHANAPGKRIVKHGRSKPTKYFERRKNRSDAPGRLTGMNAQNEMYIRRINEANRQLQETETKLQGMKRYKAALETPIARKLYSKQIKEQRKYIQTIKKNLRMLKSLMKF